MQAFLSNYPILFSVFILGFSASGHCIAMCGGLLSVLNVNNENFSFTTNLVFHSGRLFAYSLLGLVFGFGIQMASAQSLIDLAFYLRLLSALVMVLVAFYLLGFTKAIKKLDQIAIPIWRRINPYVDRLLPLDSFPKAFVFGSLWIFLPCGLVYSALTLSLTTANAFWSALAMFVFGLATTPALLLGNSVVAQLSASSSFRYFSALLLLLFAFWVVVLSLDLFGPVSGHSHH